MVTSTTMTARTTTPTFRAATLDDAAAIQRLLIGARLPLDGVGELLAKDARRFVVAVTADERELVAVAGLAVCCNNARLRSVAVRSDWQRAGLGQELVRRVVGDAEARGIHAQYLLTMTGEHYFPRSGFETVHPGSFALPS
jgi:N-acetylglutamate synthase-like GNAT family acetyltransferase